MCFKNVSQFTRCVVFSASLLTIGSGLGTTLILKPIQQQSVSLSTTPFPPRLAYKVPVRSGSSKTRSHHSNTENTNIVQIASLKSLRAARANINDLPEQQTLPTQEKNLNKLNISPLIFNPIALSISPILSLDQYSKNIFSKPPTQDSIWSNMSEDFSLDHNINRPEVNAQIAKWRRNKKDLYETLRVAAPYISYVYEQTQKRGLPAELALLPIIESEFNPNNRSNRGATGIWQIMPGTASELGLRNHRGYDGRRDIVASTNAALNYLRDLHQTLGNWQLALAAYNWGPGNIAGVVKRQNRAAESSSFWNLPRLPTETKIYVPKLLALADMIQNPERYNIKLPSIANGPHLASVKVGAHVDLKQIAESTGISEKAMRKLNPGYSNMATVPGAPNTLLLPIEKIALLALKDKIFI